MIRIDFLEPTTQSWIKWRARCSQEQLLHNQAVVADRRPKAKSSVYGEQKEQVYIHKDGPFHGKCAYCESDIYLSMRGDVDHYRPKGAIKHENNRPVMIEVNGVEQPHPGYYWLAYDWMNLLPSCQMCNQPSLKRSGGRPIGKRDYFPLQEEAFRAKSPGEEVNEKPLLIHPVWDDPDEHLAIDSTGVLSAKTPRGHACIYLLGLNERDLPSHRKAVYRRTQRLTEEYLIEAGRDLHSERTTELFEQILAIKAGREQFTMVARLAIKDTFAAQKAAIQRILDS